MDRIKDLTRIIIQDEAVLLEIVEKNHSGIVMANATGPEADYCVVSVVGEKVNKVMVGDIVLRFDPRGGTAYEYKGKAYMMINQFAILMAITPDNFDGNGTKLILN